MSALESLEDAEDLAKTFKEFAYVVSHDLGTPLRAMVEFSRLLKLENANGLSEESRLFLSLIIENGEKAQAMLGGLLDYSRLNTTAKPFFDTDLNTLLSECRETLADKIKTKKAKLTVTPLPTLKTDMHQLKQLFLALMDNALTFHQPNIAPEITVSASRRMHDWLFSVRDNGIGIEQKFHDRIFHPFKRLHTDSEYPGIGMGLALAKKIVERHRGRIWVDSIAGQGSVFLFSIPDRKVR